MAITVNYCFEARFAHSNLWLAIFLTIAFQFLFLQRVDPVGGYKRQTFGVRNFHAV